MNPDRAFPIRTGNSSFQSNVASGHARVHMGDVYNVTHSGAAPPSLREQILDSLWFDMMEARQDNIKGATPETLHWIYETERSRRDVQYGADSGSENPENDDRVEQDWYRDCQNEQDWDSLAAWLEEGDSIYWVCGKAGSGKSTLMAHVVDDDRTLDCLMRWAKGKPLHILKFFFWRPGTELQKSVHGLLRALLYQLCTQMKDAISQVVKASRWNPSRPAPWSDKRLNLAIEAALSSSDHAFCLFMDGLDEFVGDFSTLTDLIYQLEALENVKLCVSSRPEAELTAALSSCKQLRLERLNRADIKKFVKKQLHRVSHKPVFTTSELRTFSEFVDEVVNRAHGVFLWAILVLPTVLRGIVSGDDWNMLHVRLAQTPTAINDLYASMLSNLDPLHRESFYCYVESMRTFRDDDRQRSLASVADVTAAQLGEKLLNMSYDDFLRACDLEKLRINSRSVGLLQISINTWDHSTDLDPEECVAVHQLIAHDGIPAVHIRSARDAAKLRRPVPLSACNLDAHFRVEVDVLEWIHRSAHDFIFPPDGSASPMCNSHPGRADVCKKFLLGKVSSLAVSPSFVSRRTSGFKQDMTLERRLSDLFKMTDHIISTETAIALEIAEKMRSVVCNMPNEEIDWIDPPYAREDPDPSLNAFPFWVDCWRNEAWSLVETLMPILLSEPAGNALFVPLWNRIAETLDGWRFSESSPQRISMRLLEKIEQNIWLPGEANAQVVLYYHEGKPAEERGSRRANHLSCIVPDFLGLRQPAAMHMLFEQYLSTGPRQLSKVLVAYFDRVAASLRLFSSIDVRPSRIYFDLELSGADRCRVLLQCSHQLRRWLASGTVLLGHDPKYCDELRFLCLPTGHRICYDDEQDAIQRDCQGWEEITEFIYVKPSSRTSLFITQGILFRHSVLAFELRDYAMLQTWTRMLVEDIWENDQGLSGTQQLFALACVKWAIPRWLGGTMDFCYKPRVHLNKT